MPTELKCPRCNAAVPETSRFCSTCGAAVTNPGDTGASSSRLSDSGAQQLKILLLEETRGEYEIEDELGRGGMAIVYKAREVHLAREVALKVLPPELTFGKGAIERFKREAKTAAALDHPNIIPIYRIAPGGRLFWYAMKFLEGRSLADILEEKGLLTVTETIGILEQVAEALDYAHQRSVIHRDVKPGNVMLDARGRVIMTDFGIAKELQSGALTGSGAILGTPYYMSPEQCRGGTLTGAADQYSLGIMAYQMLSGHLPFEAESAIDLLHKHCVEPPPPLDALLPSLPKYVIAAVNRAVSKKADERFPTVTAFVNAMKGQAAVGQGDATLIMHRRASVKAKLNDLAAARKPSRLRSLGGIAVGVVAVGGLVAGSVWFATGGQERLAQAVAPAPEQADSAIGVPVPAAPTTGLVTIESLPGGGKVTIDGRDTTGTSFTLPKGVHVLGLTAAGFEPMVDSVTLAGGDTNRVVFAARPIAPPPAASDRAAADRPASAARAESIRRANRTRERTTTPARDTTTRAGRTAARPDSSAARPAASGGKALVVVTVAGGWANITVDGTPRRQSPWRDSLPEGTHTISVSRDGWEAVGQASKTVRVRAGRDENVTFVMRQRSAP